MCKAKLQKKAEKRGKKKENFIQKKQT